MHVADTASLALGATVAFAVAARLARTLTTGGAAAGLVIGAATSLAFGLAGLATLGAFFVVGSAATRVGWGRKIARGTAERGGGARDARRVVGKGGVAALAALLAVL